MEESNRNLGSANASLSELEKNVLDEYILDLKNMPAIIPLHEENNRALYDQQYGAGASLALLKNHFDYVMENGDFTREEIQDIIGHYS